MGLGHRERSADRNPFGLIFLRGQVTAPFIKIRGFNMLSLTTLAVTTTEADAYVAARGLSGWPSDTTAKTVALRRGQDYIAGLYNTLWLTEWTVAPDEVKFAIIEAAWREAVTPGVLLPDVTPGTVKVLTGVKGITWERVKTVGGVESLRPSIPVIDGLLTGLVASGSTAFLDRA
jgi:hypothetical protein